MNESIKTLLVAAIARKLEEELPKALKSTEGDYIVTIHILPGHKEAKIEMPPRVVAVRPSTKRR